MGERVARPLGTIRAKMRDDGIIATRRGAIIVKDEDALRRASCDCSKAIQEHFDTVLNGIYEVG